MKCQKCKKGELEESEFCEHIAICDNLECLAEFEDTSDPYSYKYIGVRF
jgi:hypothetical protein